jgi:hypothetical protein
VILFYLFIVLDFILVTRPQWYATDWGPVWTAGKVAWSQDVYDAELLSRLQVDHFRDAGIRPFAYPPTALLLFAPLALIPFWSSFVLFSVGSLIALASTVKRSSPFVLTAPPVILAAMAGQPTLLFAALVVRACLVLDRNEASAGVMFGIAAALKPHLLILAPVALVAGQHWRAIGTATVTASGMALISAALFGFGAWTAWLNSLPGFQNLVQTTGHLLRSTASPYGVAARYDAQSIWICVVAAFAVVPVTALAFRRGIDPLWRAAALGGSILVLPYSMNYDLAVFAPAILAARLERPSQLIAPTIWATSLFVGMSAIGSLIAYALTSRELIRNRYRSASEQADLPSTRPPVPK